MIMEILCRLDRDMRQNKRKQFTIVPVAGDGGMGEEEVVEVGVLLDWRNISSSIWPWGDVAIKAAAREKEIFVNVTILAVVQ